MGFLAQFTVSLIAILALAWLARWLGLGRNTRIKDEAHARRLANEVVFDFEAQDIALDEGGHAALLRDEAGAIILIKLHGVQFCGRMLGTESHAAMWQDRGKTSLEVQSGERLFGKAFLNIAAPEEWLEAINSAGEAAHA